MKTTISITLSVLLLAATSSPSFAQSAEASKQVNDRAKNEISVSYGTITITQISAVLGGLFVTAFSGGNIVMEKFNGKGAISLSYYRALNNWLAVGADLACENASLTLRNKITDTRTESPVTAFSPMLTAKGNWLRRNHFDIYSRISAGAMIMKNPVRGTVNATFIAQVSPIGLEFGGINFRGFIEGGAGAQGSIIAGLKFRF